MNDPSIQSYERPLYQSDVTDYGTFILEDYYFYFGVFLKGRDEDEYLNMPESIGRFVEVLEDRSHKPLVSCKEHAFKDLNLDPLDKLQKALDLALCLDP
mmetsp:Transcript_37317/g.49075  ORF Transcript_37317/g.49075 Transcript_37317/m.49075 type:complete len:99 (+) Transcript_37317:186-482(+)|eukprot:CAMPEP_0185599466 /NCGR_PEP_ID=MMETSP0434-20130131/82724_1 /TAXON_ID=626734 ORGANISM="Favella taraikaensis, Strain Fe Narragansett Bay" /NCGR_SAMPLE_ID=MMETSP0434 /ASSEMBLY_ACC=CAM_ASM_000379 /LENGTH=98 /DNA_ID=CAMNT_0028228877 /DNA_START=101 /DNA_END=397 /DNA_ORIENTATION=-